MYRVSLPCFVAEWCNVHLDYMCMQWGWMVACLEWSVFVSTHRLGSRWKEEFRLAPFWVKKVMENGEGGVKENGSTKGCRRERGRGGERKSLPLYPMQLLLLLLTNTGNCLSVYAIPAGFYTPTGAFTVAGIHGLPLALYYWSHPFLWPLPPVWLCWAAVGVLGLGRCLCAAVEVRGREGC